MSFIHHSSDSLGKGSFIWRHQPGGRLRHGHRHQHERRPSWSVLLLPGKHHLVQSEISLQRWVNCTWRFFSTSDLREELNSAFFFIECVLHLQTQSLKTTRSTLHRIPTGKGIHRITVHSNVKEHPHMANHLKGERKGMIQWLVLFKEIILLSLYMK